MGLISSIAKRLGIGQKMLSPKAEHPELLPKTDIKNARLPDGTTTNPSTVGGYNFARQYFPEDKAPRLTKKSSGEIVPENKITATPTLMPSTMKNIATPTVIQNQNVDIGTTKKQEKVNADLYDAAEKYGAALGVPKEIILANSRWEHRNNPDWNNGKYVDNVWWNEAKKTGEESYGPGQINMRWYGPKAIELGRKPGDLYITPEDAKDPWKAAEWMAKNFSKQAQKYINRGEEPDWVSILQSYNSGETDRGKNVKNLSDTTEFVRS